MGDKPSRGSGKPPDWWNQDLYSYLSDMPRLGWVWEFRRRSRLKQLVIDGSVEAMIPLNQLMQTAKEGKWSERESLSLTWEIANKASDPDWFFLPPAVEVVTGVEVKRPALDFRAEKFSYIIDSGFPPFHRDHLKIPMTVDIGQRDSVIRREFNKALKQLRKQNPLGKVSPRPKDWLKNKVLQVWDLRDYDVSWNKILSILPF